jgi:hypothetical protein
MEERRAALVDCLQLRLSTLVESILPAQLAPTTVPARENFCQTAREIIEGFLKALSETASPPGPIGDGLKSAETVEDPFTSLGVCLARSVDLSKRGGFILNSLGRLQQASVDIVSQAGWTAEQEHWARAWLACSLEKVADAFREEWQHSGLIQLAGVNAPNDHRARTG